MRIAFPTTNYPSEASFAGGPGNYIQRMCLALQKLSHEPVVFVMSERDEEILWNGVPVVRVGYRNRNRLVRLLRTGSPAASAWMSLLLNQAIARIHKQHPFDYVQYSSYRATGLLRVRSLPSVVRISSYRPLWREGYLVTNPSTKEREEERLERIAYLKTDAVYGPSTVVAEAVSSDLGIDVNVIEPPFVLDVATEDTQIYDKRLKNKHYLLYFGHLTRIKGVDVLAVALPEVMKRHPDLYVVLIGKDGTIDGASMREHVVQNVTSKLGSDAADRLIHMEPMTHEKLYPIITGARLVVLPSRVDNLPNTALESMALGQIVVGTHGASFEQLINDGKNGFLCPIGDPHALAQAIEKALSLDAPGRQRMSQSARKRIEDLSPENSAKSLVDYLESNLPKKASSRHNATTDGA